MTKCIIRKWFVQCAKFAAIVALLVGMFIANGGLARAAQCTERVFVGDFNGDGLTDVIRWRGSDKKWEVYLSTGHGFIKETWDGAWGSDGPIFVGDLNGDGNADVFMWRDSDKSWTVNLSTGSGFQAATWNGAWGSDGPIFLGDLNGDGKTDVFMWRDSDKSWTVNLSTGSGFQTAIWKGAWGSDGPINVGDLNGDGKTDVFMWRDSDKSWTVNLSTGSGFQTAVWKGAWGSDGPINVGDLNGDGKADVFMWRASDKSWTVNLSTGSGFQTAIWKGVWGSDGPINVGDLNGDQKTDLFMWRGDSWTVNLSTGSNWTPAEWNGLPGTGCVIVGDVNSDHRTDVLMYHPETDGFDVNLSTGSGWSTYNWPRTPLYNDVYGIATHNSYWINRSDQVDYFSSGTQELISDQLLHEHVRAIELDVHSEGAPDHQWKVYHTSSSEDFSCRYLSDCLEYLRNFQYAIPKHEVINVIVELKNTVPYTGADAFGIHTNFNFDAKHTIEDFDAIFRNALGDELYTPADFLARCDGNVTMRDCAKTKGWPTIEQLRGKFIINIMGNWSTAAYDWAQYAGQNVRSHVAFPIQSVFNLYRQPCNDVAGGIDPPATTRIDLTFDGGTVCIRDIDDSVDPSPFIDGKLRQAAFDASVFWQLEDVYTEAALSTAATFLGSNGVIRGHDAFEYMPDCIADGDEANCQERRVRSGFQFVQTDYPWHVVNDSAWSSVGIPVDPSQRFKDPASLPDANGNVRASFSVYHEPGSRIYFESTAPWPGAWAFATVAPLSMRWLEATVSSTRHGDTWGENTHNGLILDDYVKTCPGAGTVSNCTNFARTAQEDGEGCIKVASDSENDAMEICRQKNTTPGASYYQESVDLYVRVIRNGKAAGERQWRAPRYAPCKSSADPNSGDVSDLCIGSMIALSVRNAGDAAQVSVYSAGKLGASTRSPEWHVLQSESFGVPMTKQGFRGYKSELFAGPRMADHLIGDGSDLRPDSSRLREITLSDLPNRNSRGPSKIVDLSAP